MLRVTPARPEDLGAIRALLGAAALPTDDVGPDLLANFLVLRDEAKVLGTAAIERLAGCALLRSVAVDEALRGQGYGSRLCDAAEELAKSQGLSLLFLLTTTAPDFFASRGFRPVNREAVPEAVRATREFSSLCPSTAIVMAKP